MLFKKRDPNILESIEDSGILSKGQKAILKVIVQCEQGLPSTSLIQILKISSRQGLYFNIRKLLDSEFIVRKKESVHVYEVNEQKMLDLIKTYNQVLEIKLDK